MAQSSRTGLAFTMDGGNVYSVDDGSVSFTADISRSLFNMFTVSDDSVTAPAEEIAAYLITAEVLSADILKERTKHADAAGDSYRAKHGGGLPIRLCDRGTGGNKGIKHMTAGGVYCPAGPFSV